MRRFIPRIALVALLAGVVLAVPSTRLHIIIPGRTVHNSRYLAGAFLYQLQPLVGTNADSPKVLDGKIVQRGARNSTSI